MTKTPFYGTGQWWWLFLLPEINSLPCKQMLRSRFSSLVLHTTHIYLTSLMGGVFFSLEGGLIMDSSHLSDVSLSWWCFLSLEEICGLLERGILTWTLPSNHHMAQQPCLGVFLTLRVLTWWKDVQLNLIFSPPTAISLIWFEGVFSMLTHNFRKETQLRIFHQRRPQFLGKSRLRVLQPCLWLTLLDVFFILGRQLVWK